MKGGDQQPDTKLAPAAPLSTVRTANARCRYHIERIRPAAIRGSVYHTDCVSSSPRCPNQGAFNAPANQYDMATATLRAVGNAVYDIQLRGDLLIRHTRGLVRGRHYR